MTFKKPLGPNGMVITMVLGKAGSRQGRAERESLLIVDTSLHGNCVPKVPFWKSLKIESVTQIQHFSKDRHWDPPETVPGSGSEKT